MSKSGELSPHSVEAEEAVLGAVLINPDTLLELSFLQAADFFIVRHAWIWEAMLAMHERRDPIDYLTIVSELEQLGRLSEIGGAATILSLVNKTPSALNAEGYGRIVERMALRRRLIEAAGKIARVAHSEETDIENVISQAEGAVFEVTENSRSSNLIDAASLSRQVYDQVRRLRLNPDYVDGVLTYVETFDKMVRCLRNGKLHAFAAPTGMFKSALAAHILRENARRGIRGLMFSLEMDAEELFNRMLAGYAKINSEHLDHGRFDDEQNEWERFCEARLEMESWPYLIDESAGVSATYIRRELQRAVLRGGVQYAIVDYLQKIQGGEGETQALRMAHSMDILESVAKELRIPIIIFSQVNRKHADRQNKVPLLTDMEGASAIEKKSHTATILYRPWEYDKSITPGNVEMHLKKNRSGLTGMVEVRFIVSQHRVVSLTAGNVDVEMRFVPLRRAESSTGVS